MYGISHPWGAEAEFKVGLRDDVKPSSRNKLSCKTGVSGFTISWLCGERHFAFPGGFNDTSSAGEDVKHNCTNKQNDGASRRHSFRLLVSKPTCAPATVYRCSVYKYMSNKKQVVVMPCICSVGSLETICIPPTILDMLGIPKTAGNVYSLWFALLPSMHTYKRQFGSLCLLIDNRSLCFEFWQKVHGPQNAFYLTLISFA